MHILHCCETTEKQVTTVIGRLTDLQDMCHSRLRRPHPTSRGGQIPRAMVEGSALTPSG